jgi:hypothetical protein
VSLNGGIFWGLGLLLWSTIIMRVRRDLWLVIECATTKTGKFH